jgi:small ligand-binding sensory domain FIST
MFPYGHATHPQWQVAAGLVLAQLRAHMASPDYASAPTLGLLYITDHYAPYARDLLALLSGELPEVTDWSGTVGVGIAANNVEYLDEPALAVMLCAVPAHQYRVFSGVAPLNLGFEANCALVHADGQTPDLPELLQEMAERTASGYLFGGVSASRFGSVQFAVGGDGNISGHGAVSGVFEGGLSGVAFDADVALVSRVTQGCQPVSPTRVITAAERNLVLELDGQPALQTLLDDLGVSLDEPQEALTQVRATLVGLLPAVDDDARGLARRAGSFGSDVLVRHIIGLDPLRQGVAVSDWVEVGTALAFCQRNTAAARADLMRVCTEIREELEPEELPAVTAHALADVAMLALPHPARRMAGAVYVSCSGRGGAHFGGESAELQLIRRALGDVPLVGFFAGGEIARHHLYGYTGVLTVFTTAGAS